MRARGSTPTLAPHQTVPLRDLDRRGILSFHSLVQILDPEQTTRAVRHSRHRREVRFLFAFETSARFRRC
jgi:hypothetical protein